MTTEDNCLITGLLKYVNITF